MGAGGAWECQAGKQRRKVHSPSPGAVGSGVLAAVGSSVPADAVRGRVKERLGVLQSDPCWHSVWWQRKSTGSGGLRPGPAIAIVLEKVLHLLGLILHP